jgi:hypothetical protein
MRADLREGTYCLSRAIWHRNSGTSLRRDAVRPIDFMGRHRTFGFLSVTSAGLGLSQKRIGNRKR